MHILKMENIYIWSLLLRLLLYCSRRKTMAYFSHSLSRHSMTSKMIILYKICIDTTVDFSHSRFKLYLYSYMHLIVVVFFSSAAVGCSHIVESNVKRTKIVMNLISISKSPINCRSSRDTKYQCVSWPDARTQEKKKKTVIFQLQIECRPFLNANEAAGYRINRN